MAGILDQVNNFVNKAGDVVGGVNNAIDTVTGGIFGGGGQNDAMLKFQAHLDSIPRTNRYEAMIIPPTTIANAMPRSNASAVQEDARRVNLFIESVSFPGKNIRTSANETVYGPSYEVAQGLTYAEDITVTFYMRNDHTERWFFNAWQDLIVDPATYNLNYYDTYTSTMDVYQLDENNNKVAGIRISEIFPKTIGALEFSQTSSQYHKGTVSFAFKEWIPLQNNGGSWQPYENYIEQRILDQRPTRRKGLFEDLGNTFNKAIAVRNQIVGAQQKVVAIKNFFKGITKNPLSNLGIRF
jgi:hypothetical protein